MQRILRQVGAFDLAALQVDGDVEDIGHDVHVQRCSGTGCRGRGGGAAAPVPAALGAADGGAALPALGIESASEFEAAGAPAADGEAALGAAAGGGGSR